MSTTITQVAATNMKGRSIERTLAPLTIIAGPNNSGKTTTLDAIKYALLGYIPGLAKTNKGIFQAASAGEMEVSITLSDNTVMTRRLKQQGERIMSKATGEDDKAMPVAVLDGDQFWGASDGQRVQQVFEAAHIKFDSVVIKGLLLKSVTEKAVQLGITTALAAENDEEKENPQAWLNGVLERMKKLRSQARERANTFSSTATGLANISLGTVAECEGAITKLQAEIKELRDEASTIRGALKERRASAEEALRVYAKWEKERVAIQDAIPAGVAEVESLRSLEEVMAEIATIEAENKQVADAYTARLEAFRKSEKARLRVTELEKRLNEAISKLNCSIVAEKLIDELRGENLAASAEIATEQQKLDDAVKEYESLTAETKATQAKFAAVEADFGKYKSSIEAEIAGYEAMSSCPTCLAEGTDWKKRIIADRADALKSVEDEHERQMESLSIQAESTTGRMEILKPAISAQKAVVNAAKAKDNSEALSFAVADIAAKAERTAAFEAAEQLFKEAGELALINIEEPSIEAFVDERLSTLESEKTVIVLTSRMAAHMAVRPVLHSTNYSKDEQEATKLDNDSDGLEKQLSVRRQGLENLKSQERDIEEARSRSDKIKLEYDAWVAAVAHLEQVKTELVEKAFNPILETMKVFTKGIIPCDLEYREGSLGFFDEGNWVTLQTLGGAYRKIVCAGLQAALAANAPLKICIVDELGVMDSTNKLAFLKNVQQAITDGLLSQCIAVDAVEWNGKANFYHTNIKELEPAIVIETGNNKEN